MHGALQTRIGLQAALPYTPSLVPTFVLAEDQLLRQLEQGLDCSLQHRQKLVAGLIDHVMAAHQVHAAGCCSGLPCKVNGCRVWRTVARAFGNRC